MNDPRSTRRRVLFGTGALLTLTGCAGINDEGGGTTQSSTTRSSSTETTTATQTQTETETKTETASTEDEGPGYKKNHWHGRLFFEIDGNLVDFARSKYYLQNIEKEQPEAVYFHFHDSAHGPNEWSNEKKIITFQRALNLLPGINYEQQSGDHVITYEGTTFDASRSATGISIFRGTKRIDPTTYEVQHDDNFWVHIQTDGESKSNADKRTGKLVVDVNNHRLNFEAGLYQQMGSERFDFRDDGKPYTWYNTGEPVTLSRTLSMLPNIKYEQENGGNHVVTFDTDGKLGGTYHETKDVTQIIARQRTTPIDPTTYELQDGDIIWVYVHTSNAPDNEH